MTGDQWLPTERATTPAMTVDSPSSLRSRRGKDKGFVTRSHGHPLPATGARVLVVDDHPDSAETASMLLTLHGYECRTATTGHEALDQAAMFDPDIVLLDIGLPDITGYEVARTLRARAGDRPLYIAAVTGWGEPADLAKAFAAGFDHHVTKPADLQNLSLIVWLADQRSTLLRRGASGASGEVSPGEPITASR